MGLFPKRKSSRKSNGGGGAAAFSSKQKKDKPAAAAGEYAEAYGGETVGVGGSESAHGAQDAAPPDVSRVSSSSSSSQRHQQQHDDEQQQQKQTQRERQHRQKKASGPPSLANIPSLLSDLRSASDPAGEVPARALRTLFALSEQSGEAVPLSQKGAEAVARNRIDMVQGASRGELIPELLHFLDRCGRGSSEQYLCLLVLNNVSIPKENKRLIAIDHGGARELSRHLVADPSCHLLAIILVNLSFSDAELRRDISAPASGTQMVDALSYALQVSCRSASTSDVGGVEERDEERASPKKMLAFLVLSERRQRAAISGGDRPSFEEDPFDPSDLLFPETARWCLCAIKNLTRPSSAVQDSTATLAVIESGTVPVLLRVAKVSPANGVSAWDSNSVQDAAMTALLNLASSTAAAEARKYLVESGAVEILVDIAEVVEERNSDDEKMSWLELQRLKARMALALLLGFVGNFGQPRRRTVSPNSRSRSSLDEFDFSRNGNHPALSLMRSEPEYITEIFADVLHHRSRDGPGGYSATTFTLRGIIMSLRCLLTVDSNRKAFTDQGKRRGVNDGTKVNALLLKALAIHSLQKSSSMDAETAEHACWSLYLMSEFGFHGSFLPIEYGPSQVDFDHHRHHPRPLGGLAVKILLSFMQSDYVTPQGRHAANQLLLRVHFMVFEGASEELGNSNNAPFGSDFVLSADVHRAAESVSVDQLSRGATPRDDIFDRPILRSKAQHVSAGSPTENLSPLSMEEFPSALKAVSQLSFGSTAVRHFDSIDDIQMANNIAQSADEYIYYQRGGSERVGAETYNFIWRWLDEVNEDVGEERRESDQRATPLNGHGRKAMGDSFKDFLTSMKPRTLVGDEEPVSIFGFKCCSADIVA